MLCFLVLKSIYLSFTFMCRRGMAPKIWAICAWNWLYKETDAAGVWGQAGSRTAEQETAGTKGKSDNPKPSYIYFLQEELTEVKMYSLESCPWTSSWMDSPWKSSYINLQKKEKYKQKLSVDLTYWSLITKGTHRYRKFINNVIGQWRRSSNPANLHDR